jgi:RecA-family ATPase
VISRAGADAILAAPDRSGIVKPTAMFEQLRTDALNLRPKLIVIDTAADVFAGNEIDRSQTRQFITLLRGLAMATSAALILLSHPSLSGLKSASGLSGSTAWHNSVRARMYLAAVTSKDEDDDDEVAGAELRKLQFVKNNYGPAGNAVVLRWSDGIFAPEPVAGSIDAVAAAAKADDVFMTLLRRFTIEGRTVSHNGSNKHAPSLFAKEDAAKNAGIKKRALNDAMTRLFNSGHLKVHTEGSKSHKRSFLVEVEK